MTIPSFWTLLLCLFGCGTGSIFSCYFIQFGSYFLFSCLYESFVQLINQGSLCMKYNWNKCLHIDEHHRLHFTVSSFNSKIDEKKKETEDGWHHYALHTQEEGSLAHGLKAAAAVLINRSVTGCQDDQHPVIRELLASGHWSLQETSTPRCDHLI